MSSVGLVAPERGLARSLTSSHLSAATRSATHRADAPRLGAEDVGLGAPPPQNQAVKQELRHLRCGGVNEPGEAMLQAHPRRGHPGQRLAAPPTCVVLPEPVSPESTTTWFSWMVRTMSSWSGQVGSPMRACSISAKAGFSRRVSSSWRRMRDWAARAEEEGGF
jgi:hypothetical protein